MKKLFSKDDIKKILISRTDKIGDVILTLPAVTECKKQFNNAEVTLLTNSSLEHLLNDYDDIDNLIFIDRLNSFADKLKAIKKNRFDIVFCAYPRLELAIIFSLCGIKYRVGTAYRGYSFLYNIRVQEHRKFADKHEAQYNLNLINSVTGNNSTDLLFKFRYDTAEEEKLFLRLREQLNFDLKTKYIIIHSATKDSAAELPLNIMSEYIVFLLNNFQEYSIILTGSEEDGFLINCLLKNIGGNYSKNIINTAGLLNLRELLILINNSDLFVANSTGPIHIAGALGKKIIGFYPNRAPMLPERWKPLSKKAKIITPTEGSVNMNEINIESINKLTIDLLNKSD